MLVFEDVNVVTTCCVVVFRLVEVIVVVLVVFLVTTAPDATSSKNTRQTMRRDILKDAVCSKSDTMKGLQMEQLPRSRQRATK